MCMNKMNIEAYINATSTTQGSMFPAQDAQPILLAKVLILRLMI